MGSVPSRAIQLTAPESARRTAGAVIALLAIAGLGAAVPAGAVARGRQREAVVWNQYTADSAAMRLVSSAPDGSQRRELTPTVTNVRDQDPVFSPDGRTIVFNRYDDRPGRPAESVAVVDARGGPGRILELGCRAPCVADDLPSWASNGRRLVFTRVVGPIVNGNATSAVLWSANLDGTVARRMSPPGIDGHFEDTHARFARDGSYLVFVRLDLAADHTAIFRMRPDGTHLRQLTGWTLNADLADVSPAAHGPTRDQVVFESYGHGDNPGQTQRVSTVSARCSPVASCATAIRYVTPDVTSPDAAFNPVWSPNGQRIAYCAFRDNGPDEPAVGVVTTILRTGKHRSGISDPSEFAYRPDWAARR